MQAVVSATTAMLWKTWLCVNSDQNRQLDTTRLPFDESYSSYLGDKGRRQCLVQI